MPLSEDINDWWLGIRRQERLPEQELQRMEGMQLKMMHIETIQFQNIARESHDEIDQKLRIEWLDAFEAAETAKARARAIEARESMKAMKSRAKVRLFRPTVPEGKGPPNNGIRYRK